MIDGASSLDSAMQRLELTSMVASIRWSDIMKEFEELKIIMDGAMFPSEDEIDCFKASLAQKALVKSDLEEKFRYGRLLPLPPGKERGWMLERLSVILGNKTAKASIPSYIWHNTRDHMQIVSDTIKREKLTLEFVYSWGELQRALGGFIAFVIGDDAARNNFIKGIRSAVEGGDVTLQKYWYAHWLTKHNARKRPTRNEIDDELAEICLDIKNGSKRPVRYRKQWFADMISEDPKDPGNWVLKTTYTRARADELDRMVENRLIPLSALPPLEVSEFPDRIRARKYGLTHPQGRKPAI